MNAEMKIEVDRLIRALNVLPENLAQQRMRILSLAGSYGAAGIEDAAPRSSAPHYRYSTPKLTKKLRAPKGMGVVVASYLPGNLKQSIRVLQFKRSKSAVFIGAKLAKGQSPKGRFGTGSKADGYYMHMVEGGTIHSAPKPFVMSGWRRSENQVLRVITSEVTKVVEAFKSKNGF